MNTHPITTAKQTVRKSRLEVIDGRTPRIGGSGENLRVYLDPVDSSAMRERMGREKIVSLFGSITKTAGTSFKSADGGTLVGGRFLFTGPQGEFVGALNYTRMGRSVVVSNIYVRPDFRRQGIATRLIDAAVASFPKLRVDSGMTEMGADFFGHADTGTPDHEGPSI